jgi:hypothetical protein
MHIAVFKTDFGDFSGQYERHEDHAAFDASHGIAAINPLLYRHFSRYIV